MKISASGIVVATFMASYALFGQPSARIPVPAAESSSDSHSSLRSNTPPRPLARAPRLGDGCLLVYLDVGANIGVHTRFLFEPDKYPNAGTARGLFDTAFSTGRDNRDMCAFGFEPNPAHKARHESLKAAYEKVGWRYHYIQAGASDQEGKLTFWHKTGVPADSGNEEWGFSSVKRTENDTPEEVPLVHLTNWIQHHIVERQLPNKVYGQYGDTVDPEQGKVVMKMDIEGAEYTVLPSLLFSGVFCQGIDVTLGEEHARYAKFFSRPAMDTQTGRGKLDLNYYQNKPWFELLVGNLYKSVNPKDCKGTWLTLDDESHLHDGVPFPEGPVKAT